jgi:prepilin-type N-terminal cleavage/methylation domain-containing protein
VQVDRQAGHSLTELLVAMAVLSLVVATTAGAFTATLQLSQTQPRRFDLQQQARVALDLIARDVRGAGAGPNLLGSEASLFDRIPAVWPRRLGRAGDAPEAARETALTTITVPESDAQARSLAPVEAGSRSLALASARHCGATPSVCGFTRGTTVLVVGPFGLPAGLHLMSTERVDAQTLVVEPVAMAALGIDSGAAVTEVVIRGYEFDSAAGTLLYFDGESTRQTLIEDVAGFRVRYFDRAEEVTPAMLADGPWEGSGDTRFDRDVLRIQRVRLELTLANGRDQFASVLDVAPRNLRRAGGTF